MKRLYFAIFALALLLAAPSYAALTVTCGGGGCSSGVNIASGVTSLATGAYAVTSGDGILLGVRADQTCGTGNTVTDTSSNTYTQIDFAGAHGIQSGVNCLYVFWAKNVPTNGALVTTITFSPSVTNPAMVAVSFPGANTSTPLDVGNCSNSTNSNTSTSSITSSPSFSTVNANEIVFGVGQFGAQNNGFTFTAGYGSGADDSDHIIAVFYKVSSSTQSGLTLTLNSVNSPTNASIAAVSFSDSAVSCGGGGGTNHNFTPTPIL